VSFAAYGFAFFAKPQAALSAGNTYNNSAGNYGPSSKAQRS
jgi:hypothetical protein